MFNSLSQITGSLASARLINSDSLKLSTSHWQCMQHTQGHMPHPEKGKFFHPQQHMIHQQNEHGCLNEGWTTWHETEVQKSGPKVCKVISRIGPVQCERTRGLLVVEINSNTVGLSFWTGGRGWSTDRDMLNVGYGIAVCFWWCCHVRQVLDDLLCVFCLAGARLPSASRSTQNHTPQYILPFLQIH